MVRILPALVGAVALGAAAVLRRKKRSAEKVLPARAKSASAKQARKTASSRKAGKNRSTRKH